jgi:putative endonuclease
VRLAVGVRGEDLAVAELESQGMQVLSRNWRCRLGEVDVIALEVTPDRRTLVFCEVKCRTGLGFGGPLESITYAKLRKLRQLSAEWLTTERARADALSIDAIRLDAVGVVLLPGTAPQLTHVRAIG